MLFSVIFLVQIVHFTAMLSSIFVLKYKYLKWTPNFIFSIIFFLITIICYWLYGTDFSFPMLLCLLTVQVFEIFFLFEDRLAKKVLFFVVISIISFFSYFTVPLLLRLFSKGQNDRSIVQEGHIIYVSLFFILNTFMCTVWRRQVQVSKKQILLFLFFPLYQCLILCALGQYPISSALVTQIYFLLAIVLGFNADLFLFYAIFEQSKKEELEKEIKFKQHLIELESEENCSVEGRKQKILEITLWFHQQLQIAYTLIAEQRDGGDVKKILDQIQEELASTKEQRYCRNLTVNALLISKEPLFHEFQIQFDSNIEIPEDLGVEQLHLCSIFSNLLDNAIEACKQIVGFSRFINVSTMIHGGYLHIQVINSRDPKEKRRKQHENRGYGHRILEDIASLYQGSFSTKWDGKAYTATISVLIGGTGCTSLHFL